METTWHNCYDDGWRELITPLSYSHPAKFSAGLIRRIFEYLLESGYLRKGDAVCDPFAGVGTGGIVAASMGLQWFGCELEPDFARMANGYDCPGFGVADGERLGDAGRLLLCRDCRAVHDGERSGFVERGTHHLVGNFELHRATWQACGDPLPVLVCGDSRRLRANLRVVPAAVVCSPPYHGMEVPASVLQPGGRQGARSSYRAQGSDAEDRYGSTPGQLGAMKAGDVQAVVSQQVDNRIPSAMSVVSSPPYANHIGIGNGIDYSKAVDPTTSRIGSAGRDALGGPYGETAGQIGGATGETFWHAARDIVTECHAILRRGISAWVVKDFVRNKARVPFCDDWCKLLEACGFTVVERIHAMLVKETRHPDLFGGGHLKRTERKSLFRRLAEKNGSPAIDFEEIVIARKAR